MDPTLQAEDLATGVSFASGGTGFDPLTSKAVVYLYNAVIYIYSFVSFVNSIYFVCSLLQSVIPMQEQLELFIEYKAKLEAAVGSERAAAIVANSMYIVTAGSDDIVNTYFHTNLRKKSYTISNYTDFLSASASSFFEVYIYKKIIILVKILWSDSGSYISRAYTYYGLDFPD